MVSPLSKEFWKGAWGGLKELPASAKLAGFASVIVLATVLVLRPGLNGWQVIALALLVVGFFAFAIWLHRPERPPAGGATVSPPYAVLDTTALGGLATNPITFLITMNAAAHTLREKVRELAAQVRANRKKNSEADVSKRLQKVLGQPEPIVLALLEWADQKP